MACWVYEVKLSDNNIFESPTTYEDQCAFTCTEWGICRHNYFNRLTGYTNGESLTSGGPWNNVVVQGNIFDRDPIYIRNAISLEDASTLPYTNVVIDSNVCKNEHTGWGNNPIHNRL